MTRTEQDRPEPTPVQRRRERERVAGPESILAAALDVAHRDGWDAVTMRQLAEEIDYSANFAYRYFNGRDDIRLALVREGFTRLRGVMTAAAAGSTPSGRSTTSAPNPAAAAVRRAGRAYLDFALADPDLYQVMYGPGRSARPRHRHLERRTSHRRSPHQPAHRRR